MSERVTAVEGLLQKQAERNAIHRMDRYAKPM